jgi:hypothetical protein
MRQLIKGQFKWHHWQIEFYHQESFGQDSYLIQPREEYLRLAVIDGVTPIGGLSPISKAGLDSGAYGANITRISLERQGSLVDAIYHANHLLCEEGGDWITRASAQVVAVDLYPDYLNYAFVGDAQLWRCRGSSRHNLCPASIYSKEGLAVLRDAPWDDPVARANFKRERLNDRALWKSPSLGRFEDVHIEHGRLEDRQLIISTDGARLDETDTPLKEIDKWLANLRHYEKDKQKTLKPHDDVTVFTLTR